MKERNLGLWAAIIFWAIAIGWAFVAFFMTVKPAHAGSTGNAAMLLCMAHVNRVDTLKTGGMTREQLHADFDAWLEGQVNEEKTLARDEWYPPMVRAMIDSAFASEDWQHAAMRACVVAVNGMGA